MNISIASLQTSLPFVAAATIQNAAGVSVQQKDEGDPQPIGASLGVSNSGTQGKGDTAQTASTGANGAQGNTNGETYSATGALFTPTSEAGTTVNITA